jgi:hypothetical protein
MQPAIGLKVTHRGEVHGEKTTAAVAGLEDLSSQSRRRHRVDRMFVVPTISFELLYGLLILR